MRNKLKFNLYEKCIFNQIDFTILSCCHVFKVYIFNVQYININIDILYVINTYI